MNRNSIEDNQVLEELLRCSSDSESDDLFQDDTDNDPDFTTDGLLGDAITCIDGESDWYYQEAQSHPCQRPCVTGDVKTCYYRFSIEWYWAFGNK
ncbi:hypothetical protein J6590_066378 [Homalodisca vitripennis]|nr:hypothetical protein J6590_066378 [Homalodisca vitripennis]